MLLNPGNLLSLDCFIGEVSENYTSVHAQLVAILFIKVGEGRPRSRMMQALIFFIAFFFYFFPE